MARLYFFLGSSRKYHLVPFLPAFCWVGAGCVENDCQRVKLGRHNVGLCRMGGWGDGGRVKFSGRVGLVSAKASRAENFYRKGQKGFIDLQVSESCGRF